MLNHAASFLARLADLLTSFERRPEPLAIPVRRDDRRDPQRGPRRY